MHLSLLASNRILLGESSTHDLFSIDDFLSDEPIRKRQSATSRSSGPMGRHIEDIPDPHSVEPQPEPEDMPDYGINDAENETDREGSELIDWENNPEPEPEPEQDPEEWLRSGEGYVSAVGTPEPENELAGTNKPQRPGQNPFQSFYSEPERNWKSRRRQQYVGESVNRVAPVIRKNGVYVFDKDNDWPTLVEVLEVKDDQAKVQLIGAFRSPNNGKSYWVSTRDLKPDRI